MPLIGSIDTSPIAQGLGKGIDIVDNFLARAQQSQIAQAHIDMMAEDTKTMRDLQFGEPDPTKWAGIYEQRMRERAAQLSQGFTFKDAQAGFTESMGSAIQQKLPDIYRAADVQMGINSDAKFGQSMSAAQSDNELYSTYDYLKDPFFVHTHGGIDAARSYVSAQIASKRMDMFTQDVNNHGARYAMEAYNATTSRFVDKENKFIEGISESDKALYNSIELASRQVVSQANNLVSMENYAGTIASTSKQVDAQLRLGSVDNGLNIIQSEQNRLTSGELNRNGLNGLDGDEREKYAMWLNTQFDTLTRMKKEGSDKVQNQAFAKYKANINSGLTGQGSIYDKQQAILKQAFSDPALAGRDDLLAQLQEESTKAISNWKLPNATQSAIEPILTSVGNFLSNNGKNTDSSTRNTVNLVRATLVQEASTLTDRGVKPDVIASTIQNSANAYMALKGIGNAGDPKSDVLKKIGQGLLISSDVAIFTPELKGNSSKKDDMSAFASRWISTGMEAAAVQSSFGNGSYVPDNFTSKIHALGFSYVNGLAHDLISSQIKDSSGYIPNFSNQPQKQPDGSYQNVMRVTYDNMVPPGGTKLSMPKNTTLTFFLVPNKDQTGLDVYQDQSGTGKYGAKMSQVDLTALLSKDRVYASRGKVVQ